MLASTLASTLASLAGAWPLVVSAVCGGVGIAVLGAQRAPPVLRVLGVALPVLGLAMLNHALGAVGVFWAALSVPAFAFTVPGVAFTLRLAEAGGPQPDTSRAVLVAEPVLAAAAIAGLPGLYAVIWASEVGAAWSWPAGWALGLGGVLAAGGVLGHLWRAVDRLADTDPWLAGAGEDD